MIILTVPSFNIPIWPVLQTGKNEWRLTVNNCNLNAVVLFIKAPYPICRIFCTDLTHSATGEYFAIIHLDDICCPVSISTVFQLMFASPLKGHNKCTFTRLPPGYHSSLTTTHNLYRPDPHCIHLF